MYDKFKNRIIKLMQLKNFILKHIGIFIASLSLFIVFISSILINVGQIIVYNDDDIEVTYGENIKLPANAFLSKLSYQYIDEEDEEWNNGLPFLPGEYKIRGHSKSLFNKQYYSNPINLVINPKTCKLTINENSVSYGDALSLSVDLEHNDEIVDINYIYEINANRQKIYVTPDLNTIKVKNGDLDVSHCYNFIVEEKTLNYTLRPLEIKTKSITNVYTGKEFSNEATIVKGSLAFNDKLQVNFDHQEIKDFLPTCQNSASFKIVDEAGIDVTRFYDINAVFGTLSIYQKTVYVESKDAIKLDDGLPLSNDKFIYKGLYPNHTISVKNKTILNKPGTVDNVLNFIILNDENEDITHNYKFVNEYGLLTICPKITLITNSNSKEFDGTYLFDEGVESNIELPYNHHLEVIKNSKVKYFGKYDNILTVLIKDDKGNDLTSLYNPKYEYGSLTINKRDLTLTSSKDRKMYDGTGLNKVSFTTDRLLSNHKINILKVNNLDSDVNFYENSFTYEIVDEDGYNMDKNYNVTEIWQDKEIYKRNIFIEGESSTKIYDDKDIKFGYYHLYDSSLVLDHHFKIKDDFNSFKYAGNYENKFTVNIVNGNDEDVTHNYNIKYNYGFIYINQRPIYPNTPSLTKFYDKQPVYLPTYNLKAPDLISGVLPNHIFVANNDFKSFVNPGSFDNSFTFKIYDQNNVDLTKNYKVAEWGKITITKYKVIINTGSGEKYYDGLPLTNSEVSTEVKDDGNGIVNVKAVGTITNVGSVENDAIYSVVNKDGVDISEFYDFEKNYGTLTIKKRNDGQLISGEGNIESSGEIAHKKQNLDSINNQPAFVFNSDCKDKIYFRAFSFGDYNFTKWEKANEYQSSSISPIYYASKSLENAYLINNIDIKLEDGLDYLLPYFTLNGPSFKGDSNNAYTDQDYKLEFIPYVYDYRDNMKLPNELKNEEERYYQYVLDNYLDLPISTLNEMNKIIKDNNLDRNSPNIILDVQKFMRNSAVLNNNFDDYPQKEDYAVYLLTKSREGNTQHFATSATCLYRALGIPARYTVGFVSDPNPNHNVTVTWANCRAWVEVYIRGMGWISTEVAGRVVDTGDGEVIPPVIDPEEQDEYINIKPVDVVKKYDGTSLKAIDEIDIEYCKAFNELLENGYSYSVDVVGERVELGSSLSTINSITINDINGNDVTDKFKFNKLHGSIDVVSSLVEFRIKSYTKYYDGSGYTYTKDDVVIYNPDNYEISYDIHGKDNKIGISYATIDNIVIKKDNLDITNDVYIKIVGGKLNIKKIPIEISIASDVKKYDGKPLSNSNYWFSEGELLPNHHIDILIDVEITDIGVVNNIPSSIKIYDNNNNNVKFAYDIKVKQGKLQII